MFLLFVACATPEPPPAPAPAPVAAPEPAPAPDPAPAPEAPVAVQTVDLNSATADQLAAKGLGKKMQHEFDEYRPYTSIRQFRRQIGKYVGPEDIAGYEVWAYVPVDFTKADAETLAQLPGLDDAEAAELVAARPFADRAAFLAKLGEKVTNAELQASQALLAP